MSLILPNMLNCSLNKFEVLNEGNSSDLVSSIFTAHKTISLSTLALELLQYNFLNTFHPCIEGL